MTTKTKKGWGFDKRNLDTTAAPQDDFFQYSVGGWIERNKIPDTKSRWGTFYVLREQVTKDLHAIVKEMLEQKEKTAEEQMLYDFYVSAMDMKVRNKLGTKPVAKYLAMVDAVTSSAALPALISDLHVIGFDPLFGIFVGQDDKDSTRYITNIAQNGLSLGERDFYLTKDERSETIRRAFVQYATSLFVLAGSTKEQAEKDAETLLAFETKLARISMNNVDRRDITKIYNKHSLAQLQKNAPKIAWQKLFTELGLKNVAHAVVSQPEYLAKATELLETVPLATWQIYLRFDVLDGAAGMLTSKFEDTAFAFYGKVLSGRTKQEPRWKKALGTIEGGIGDILGKEYVERHFSEGAKKHINRLVDDLFVAYEKRIKALDWMTPATKKKALVKLGEMTRKLGYPNKWKSYKGLEIIPDDFFGNVFRAGLFERAREHKRLDKPVDRDEWFMYPQTVNAYYSPNMNDIAFPAGILQAPFFSDTADDAINYGAIGAVIGHEITHGFDDQGALFDGKGNYKNWWTSEDKKNFEKKTKVLEKQFNEYEVHGEKVNGKLTLGENIADLGGLSIAFDAYMTHLERTGTYAVIDGYTPEQRFFMGAAVFECGHERKESALMMLIMDPHSPSKFRVNGPASNLPEFYKAWCVEEHHKLHRKEKDRAKIW